MLLLFDPRRGWTIVRGSATTERYREDGRVRTITVHYCTKQAASKQGSSSLSASSWLSGLPPPRYRLCGLVVCGHCDLSIVVCRRSARSNGKLDCTFEVIVSRLCQFLCNEGGS